MPYKLKKQGSGYFVVDVAGHKFSKKPLTKKMARKQEIAIVLSEAKKKHIQPKMLFM